MPGLPPGGGGVEGSAAKSIGVSAVYSAADRNVAANRPTVDFDFAQPADVDPIEGNAILNGTPVKIAVA